MLASLPFSSLLSGVCCHDDLDLVQNLPCSDGVGSSVSGVLVVMLSYPPHSGRLPAQQMQIPVARLQTMSLLCVRTASCVLQSPEWQSVECVCGFVQSSLFWSDPFYETNLIAQVNPGAIVPLGAGSQAAASALTMVGKQAKVLCGCCWVPGVHVIDLSAVIVLYLSFPPG